MTASMVESEAIRITGITLLARGGSGARRSIAHFDVVCFGIRIRGCALVRDAGEVIILGPRLEAVSRTHGVVFEDVSVFDRVRVLAESAYRMIGGTDLPSCATECEK